MASFTALAASRRCSGRQNISPTVSYPPIQDHQIGPPEVIRRLREAGRTGRAGGRVNLTQHDEIRVPRPATTSRYFSATIASRPASRSCGAGLGTRPRSVRPLRHPACPVPEVDRRRSTPVQQLERSGGIEEAGARDRRAGATGERTSRQVSVGCLAKAIASQPGITWREVIEHDYVSACCHRWHSFAATAVSHH